MCSIQLRRLLSSTFMIGFSCVKGVRMIIWVKRETNLLFGPYILDISEKNSNWLTRICMVLSSILKIGIILLWPRWMVKSLDRFQCLKKTLFLSHFQIHNLNHQLMFDRPELYWIQTLYFMNLLKAKKDTWDESLLSRLPHSWRVLKKHQPKNWKNLSIYSFNILMKKKSSNTPIDRMEWLAVS